MNIQTMPVRLHIEMAPSRGQKVRCSDPLLVSTHLVSSQDGPHHSQGRGLATPCLPGHPGSAREAAVEDGQSRRAG